MSEYGRIWESIRAVREQLAAKLGVETSDLSTLAAAIRQTARHDTELAALLAQWAELEELAAKCDDRTGDAR